MKSIIFTLRRSYLRAGLVFVLAGLLIAFGRYRAQGFADLGSYEKNRVRLLGHLIQDELINHHFSHKKIDNAFSRDAFKLYLKQLDSQKRFLLKQDVDKLSVHAATIDDELVSGKIELPFEGEELLRMRLGRAREYVRKALAEDFDFSVDESFETDADKLDYCSSEEELQRRWYQALKYQVLQRYLSALEEDEQQKKKASAGVTDRKPVTQKSVRDKLLKNYESFFTKALHEKDAEAYHRYFNAITKAFDPHSDYMPPASKEEFDISMRGTIEGIGATLREDEGFIKVVNIIPGSPSYRQGQLQIDDVILKVADKGRDPVDITDMGLNDAVKLIRGKKGTEVHLSVRKSDGSLTVIPIIRDVVKIEDASVKSTVIKDEKTGISFGYIKIPSFYRDFEGMRNSGRVRNVTDDLRTELLSLDAVKVSGIILDLRNNGGGALTDAVKITGLFIKSGPVVQIKRSNNTMTVMSDDDPAIDYAGPLVVLVNKISASAAEILAAALQDYGRAVVIGGVQTHGKGTVQTIVDLDDRISMPGGDKYKPLGVLKLTTQKFYRVSGGSTQYRGVTPDIIIPDRFSFVKSEEQRLDFALPWDTVNPVPYEKWQQATGELEKLRERSKNRIAANKEFVEIDKLNRKIEERQKKTTQSLSIEVVRREREEFKGEETLDENPHGRTKDKKRKDERLSPEASKEQWDKEVREDIYVQEAASVLNDMLTLQPKQQRN